MNFCSFSEFDSAINPHQSSRYHGFTLTSAIGNACELKQVAECDKRFSQMESLGLHSVSVLHMR
ncbi:hypothetical protein MTYP_00880 [Methylophilaceae bacterium]|nr:hypothetical protein MTYP_00880 [Methylophilaceae bacterium]